MLELYLRFVSMLLVAVQLCLLLCHHRRSNLMLNLEDMFLLPRPCENSLEDCCGFLWGVTKNN